MKDVISGTGLHWYLRLAQVVCAVLDWPDCCRNCASNQKNALVVYAILDRER